MFNTMSAYLDSNKIKVFPCGGRNINYDPLARLTTEQNLISIINRLVDMDSFIVTTHASNQEMDNSIEEYIFNIDGYLFTVPNGVGAKNIITTTLDDYFTDNNITELTNGRPYQLLAHIRKETYQGVNSEGILMTYTQLSPTAETTPDLMIKVEIADPDNLEKINLGAVTIYKYNDTQYVQKIGDIYYQCDANGFLFYQLTKYANGLLDSSSKFNGLEFIITPKSNISNYPNTAVDKYLTLFEYKWVIEKDNAGDYYLDNDGNYTTSEPSNYTGFKYSITPGKWYEYEDSKVKFKTTTNGSQRSVKIDDGVLG